MDNEGYFSRLAAAYVRGQTARGFDVPEGLCEPCLDELSDAQCSSLIEVARAGGLRVHAFKRTQGLARVRRVLGILKGLAPESLLDIGSGRGVFLWPLLETLPHLPVTSVDCDAGRVAKLDAVRRGGVDSLVSFVGDARSLALADSHVDVVTFLEVLEHIEDVEAAAQEALRVARRFVVVSVPSKEDDNPGHVHLFTGDRLAALFENAGARRVQVEYVLNHIVAVVKVS